MSGTSTYPATLDSWIDWVAKRDKVKAETIVKVQDAIAALQLELGTDPAGSAVDLKTRLFVCIDNDGTFRKGTSFPSSPVDGQVFYRTDQDTLYVYNGTTWLGGAILSNVVFSFATMGNDYLVDEYGYIVHDSLTVPDVAMTASYWGVKGTLYKYILSTKFKKIAGADTITVYARCWNSTGNSSSCEVDIGGQIGSASTTATTATWINFTINVASLIAGTIYDVKIGLKSETSTTQAAMNSIIAFAS